MAFSFLDKDSLADAWSESQRYMEQLFEPLTEYERIGLNRPHPGIAEHLPKVTEGTLSSTIVKQPRRIFQQLPNGKVISREQPEIADVADYVLTNQIIPNATTNGTVLQKIWAATSKSLMYGSQPYFAFFTQRGNYFGADFSLPYIKDVFLESNQLCAGDSNFTFLRSWYQPSDIKAIIERESLLIKQAKERGEVYKSPWDLKLLAKLTSEVTKKDAKSMNPNEVKTGAAGGVEIVHCFQKGVGGEFYSFAPACDNKVVRTKTNPDKSGNIPIVYQYHTVDMFSPLGRGAVEHSGAAQNTLDGLLQSFVYTNALQMSPPLKKWGNGIVESTIQWRPDQIIDMGSDPNSKLEAFNISTQAISNFPNNFGLIKGIILTGANGQDSSISAESGNVGYSKTNAGVKQQQAILGVDDNYIRKQGEMAIGELYERLLNIHFGENAGRETLDIPEGDARDKLMAQFPELEEEGAGLDVVFDLIESGFEFEVDAGTSAGDDNNEQIEILTGITEEVSSNPVVLERIEAEGYEFSFGELVTRKINKSGAEDPEKIIRKLSEEEIAEKQANAQAEQMAEEEAAMQQMPQEQELPAEVESPDPEADQIAMMQESMGLNDAQMQRVIEMYDQGATTADVLQEIAA